MDTDNPKKNSSKEEWGAVSGFLIFLFMAFYGVIAYRIIAIYVGKTPFLSVQFHLDNGAAEYALGPWWTLAWALLVWWGMLAGAFVAVLFSAVASVGLMTAIGKRFTRDREGIDETPQKGQQ